MNIIISLILLTTIKTYKCQDIKQIFEKINKRVEKSNAISAEIAWGSSIDPGNPKLVYKSAVFQKENIEWQHRTCEHLESLQSRCRFNNTQIRQKYLLCRGPTYTYEEARIISNLYDELQSIYTDAKICIPTENDILSQNLTEVEAAILKYLSQVNYFLRGILHWQDPTEFAVKNGIIDVEKGKKGICLKGEEDFQSLMKFSRNEEVLKWVWLVWREKTGAMKEPYMKLVEVENAAARRNGYRDIGASWRDELEIPHLRQTCRRLYEDIRPLYTLLHGVARFYLRREYGDVVPERGAIPAHLLGNLWSQNWESIASLIVPNTIDLDRSITKLNWTVQHMVKRAEDFYQSLGLPPMTNSFWRNSVFSKNNNTRCHGTAADMFKYADFRLLYCSGTTMDDFYVLHHELGHIQYYMAYEHQPALFRQANTAFHEAIGDAIMYGVMTPQHLYRLGLINDSLLYTNDDITRESNVNINKKNKDSNNNEDIKINRKNNNIVKDNLDKQMKIEQSNNDEDINIDKMNYNTEENNINIIVKNRAFNNFKVMHINNMKDNNAKENTKIIKKNKESYEAESEYKRDIDVFSDDLKISSDDILLLRQALNKIPQIPFSLLIDEYRWKYFEGDFNTFDMNEGFWQMAFELQGIAPPMERDGSDFDIGAKFHVPDNTPYIRYFLGSFLQHQLFESVCKAAVFGRRRLQDPLPGSITLNRCDVYGSKSAGKLLKDIMSRGHSQHWRQILQETTGQHDISASALKRYYRPLVAVLEKLVRKHRIPIGW